MTRAIERFPHRHSSQFPTRGTPHYTGANLSFLPLALCVAPERVRGPDDRHSEAAGCGEAIFRLNLKSAANVDLVVPPSPPFPLRTNAIRDAYECAKLALCWKIEGFRSVGCTRWSCIWIDGIKFSLKSMRKFKLGVLEGGDRYPDSGQDKTRQDDEMQRRRKCTSFFFL